MSAPDVPATVSGADEPKVEDDHALSVVGGRHACALASGQVTRACP